MTIPNVLQAPMGALGAVGMRKSVPGNAAARKPPRYGMTMWFKVVVTDPAGGTSHLGLWSGCSGLAVNLETEPVWAGGQYLAPYLTPRQITYPNVTLERAMEARSAAQVRSWLELVAGKWISGDEGGAGMVHEKAGGSTPGTAQFRGTTVTVSLFSALVPGDGKAAPAGGTEREVAKWELRDAIPVSWSAPALSAGGGGVATEKLVLTHRGFLDAAPAGSAPGGLNTQHQGQLTLSCQGKSLELQYNPREVTEERTTRVGNENEGQTLTINGEELIYDRKKLTLSALQIEGVTAVADGCRKLWEWTDLDYSKEKKGAPKQVQLRMGSGTGLVFDEQVLIKTAKVSYCRFTTSGVPSRALVTLTLIVVEQKQKTRA